MDGLYFLAMLGGVGWLCWWATREEASWSPFTMREAVEEPAQSPAELPQPPSRPSAPQPWRERAKSAVRRQR